MINIKNKQNSQEILDLLFLQRIYCEKIENMTIKIYLFTVFIAIIGIFAQNYYYLIVLNLILIIYTNYLINKRKEKITIMATIKEIIDRTLFNLKNLRLECSREKIEEYLIVEKEKKAKRYNKEISNSGTDKYRGVRDWYSYEEELNDEQIILSCQKQNCYFTESLLGSFSKSILILVFLIFIVLLCYGIQVTIEKLIIYYLYPFATFLTLIMNDFQNYKSFKEILKELKIEFDNIKSKKKIQEKDLEKIQNLIYLYRKTEYRPPLEIIHWKFSKTLHKKWETIKKHFIITF